MAFPVDQRDVEVGLFLDGAWVDSVDVGNGVREAEPITIRSGRSNWSNRVDASTARFTLDNRDGRYSPDYESSVNFGDYRRNIPTRIGVGHGDKHLAYTNVSADVASTPDDSVGGGSPTAPAFVDVTESEETSFTTTHTFDLPATVAVGDRLLLAANFGHQTITASSDLDDWTLVTEDNLYTPWNKWVLYEIHAVDSATATALQGGTVEFTSTNSIKSSCQVIRTSGARSGGDGSAWEYTADTVKTFSDSPNPPSHTATWGADEHRWYAITFYGSAGESVSANPSGYTAVADGHVSAAVQVGSAHDTSSVATEDPGTFTLTDDENWMCVTFVYRAEEDTGTDGDLDISGDIDLRIEFQLHEDPVDVTEPGIQTFWVAGKQSGANGWWIDLDGFPSHGLRAWLYWYDSGGTLNSAFSLLPLAMLHDRSALRVTLDVDNGASGHDVAWYTSSSIDGPWSQNGSTATVSGTTSIKTNDADVEVGGSTTSSRLPFPGKIYAFEMFDGIDGTLVACPDFTAQTLGASSFDDDEGNTWTIGTGGRITDQQWRFHGELSSLPVRWDVHGSDIRAPVTAAGIFRRLRQGARRLEPPIRRAITREGTDLVQYWPMTEEGGEFLSQFGAVIGTAPMEIVSGTAQPASIDVFTASNPLPNIGETPLRADVDTYATSDAWQIRFLLSIPDDFDDTLVDIELVNVKTSDLEWSVLMRSTTGGSLKVKAFRGATEVFDSGYTAFNAVGKNWRVSLSVQQNGSDLDWALSSRTPGGVEGGDSGTAEVVGAAGQVERIQFNTGADFTDCAIGHVTLQNANTDESELEEELNAFEGETAARRVQRLCREEGIKSRIYGDPDDSEPMGPQSSATFMSLLEECAATDLGILSEARETNAVAYRVRTSLVDQVDYDIPDKTGLVRWWAASDLTATDQQELPGRAVGGTLTSGASSAAGTDDPEIVLNGVGQAAQFEPDGTDDYLQTDYTPTFTPTTGDLTIVFVGEWAEGDTTDAFNRLLSSESAGNHGILLHTSSAAAAKLGGTVGGATTFVPQGSTAGTSSLSDGDVFTGAIVIDTGTMAVYQSGHGLNTPASITGVGAITHNPIRALSSGVGTTFAHSPLRHVLIFERALTESELDAIAEKLEVLNPGALHLDYANGEVAAPLELDRDDQGLANDVEVKNWTGTTVRALLDDGSALSISEPPTGAGRYDTTFNVNASDSRLAELAATRLALTSVDEPRVSKLALAFDHPAISADTGLQDDIIDLILGDRVTVVNPLTEALGSSHVSQLVQGIREGIGPYRHRLHLFTSPSTPWDTPANTGGSIVDPPAAHSVIFRMGTMLSTPGTPAHVLTALGYTDSATIERSELDAILDAWVASTGGTTRNVTSAAEWTTAVAAALPGDLIRVTTGFDPGGGLGVRGDLYGISGDNLTTSPDGGLPGLPIIVTCADGEYVDDNDTSSNDAVLDLQNCRHVWAVGFNVRDGQFGIRAMNWGGSGGFPAYVAYCNVENIGDAGLAFQGWFQLITSSGGTPPAGSGNEWGFSEHFVCESNTVDGTGVRLDQFGEGIYLGRGSTPGWISYVQNAWVRGNTLTDWSSDGIDVKPGCSQIYLTDNEIRTGHAESGAPLSIHYVGVAIDDRPSWADRDPEIWVEGNRVYDNDVTNTDASSVHIMGYIGVSGIRVANNVFWAHPTTGTHATWRFRNEAGTNDTEALAEFRADPTWIINNTCWNDDIVDEGGYGASPTAFPTSVTDTWDFRNNIREDSGSGTSHGDVEADSADFIATVPAIGAAGDAEWETYGNGSAFDLALDSTLIGTGEDISDITLFIEEDISQRAIVKTAPNPGAFQPFT